MKAKTGPLQMTREVMNKAAAIGLGLKSYFTGKPCVHGHLSARLASDGSCMECRRIKANNFHNKNKDQANTARRQRRKNNLEDERAAGRSYRAKNIETERARTRAWMLENKERRADYVRENSHLYVAYAQKRRTAKTMATPAWYGELDEFVMREAAELCRLREIATGFAWQVDHMIPLRAKLACGLHCAANLQVIPASYNAAKRNKLIYTEPLQWLN